MEADGSSPKYSEKADPACKYSSGAEEVSDAADWDNASTESSSCAEAADGSDVVGDEAGAQVGLIERKVVCLQAAAQRRTPALLPSLRAAVATGQSATLVRNLVY